MLLVYKFLRTMLIGKNNPFMIFGIKIDISSATIDDTRGRPILPSINHKTEGGVLSSFGPFIFGLSVRLSQRRP